MKCSGTCETQREAACALQPYSPAPCINRNLVGHLVQSQPSSPSREGGSASHSMPRAPWDGGSAACSALPLPGTLLPFPVLTVRDAKATPATGCFSWAERCVRSLGSTENPRSDGVVTRTREQQSSPAPFAVPLALSALLLFDFGLLGQVQICFQITLGYVAGKFSREAAITRNSSCLSMLHRTGGSSAAPDGAFPPLLHLCVCPDSHLVSAICGELILKRQRGEKNAAEMSFAF